MSKVFVLLDCGYSGCSLACVAGSREAADSLKIRLQAWSSEVPPLSADLHGDDDTAQWEAFEAWQKRTPVAAITHTVHDLIIEETELL